MLPVIVGLLVMGEIKAPAQISAPALNRLVRIEVVSSHKNTTAILPPGEGQDYDFFREYSGTGSLQYRVLCYTGKPLRFAFVGSTGDVIEVATTDVTVGGKVPDVIPPTPDNALESEFRSLYEKDAHPEKSNYRLNLAETIRAATRICNDKTLTTSDQLYTAFQKVESGLPPDCLTAFRKAISTKLVKLLPDDPSASLTPKIRLDVETMLNRVVNVLEGVK